jgi:hypothetical protein
VASKDYPDVYGLRLSQRNVTACSSCCAYALAHCRLTVAANVYSTQ